MTQTISLESSIPQLVQSAADQFSNSPFLEEDGNKISFAEFADLCAQVSAALIAAGVEPGDRVAVWAPNISEWPIAALGAQCAGAVLVTLNTRNKGPEAAFILQQSRAKVLFSIGDFLGVDYPAQLAGESLPDLQTTVVLRERAAASEAGQQGWASFLQSGESVSADAVQARRAAVTGESLSDILFTSGTTGKPKGVMTAHGQNLVTFSHWSDIVGLRAGDRYLVVNPFFHSFGYKAGILACLLRGATLLPHAVFDAEAILQRIADENISVLPGPPTLFQSLLANPRLGEFDISSLRVSVTGAAAIPVEMIQQMYSVLKLETVVTAYGLSESCGVVTVCRPGDDAETIAKTSGRAIPDVELRCVDPDNNEVPRGEAGEIVVRGFNVMKGYLDNDEATAEAIDSDGWLHTGDIGVMDEAGNLRITDRLKDMFITGGFNCYPAEIENNLSTHPAIAMNAVIGIPDERMGEVAKAYIVLKPGESLDEAGLIDWCRQNMANYKVPRQVAFVDALPLNASGKVVKPELRKLHAAN